MGCELRDSIVIVSISQQEFEIVDMLDVGTDLLKNGLGKQWTITKQSF